MKKLALLILGIAVVAMASFFFLPAKVESDAAKPPEEPSLPTPAVVRALNQGPFDEDDLREMVRVRGSARGLTAEQIHQIEVTIGGDGTRTRGECATGESNWDPNAIGDGGRSHGLVQIFGPAHPDVTAAEALKAEYAVEFIITEFLAGNEWKWTCWRYYFG